MMACDSTDSTQETIMDVLSEMRSNEFDDPRFDRDALWAARRLAREWADRIETAFTREINARLLIDNACVAQCAVLLDDHIKAIVSEVKKKKYAK